MDWIVSVMLFGLGAWQGSSQVASEPPPREMSRSHRIVDPNLPPINPLLLQQAIRQIETFRRDAQGSGASDPADDAAMREAFQRFIEQNAGPDFRRMFDERMNSIREPDRGGTEPSVSPGPIESPSGDNATRPTGRMPRDPNPPRNRGDSSLPPSPNRSEPNRRPPADGPPSRVELPNRNREEIREDDRSDRGSQLSDRSNRSGQPSRSVQPTQPERGSRKSTTPPREPVREPQRVPPRDDSRRTRTNEPDRGASGDDPGRMERVERPRDLENRTETTPPRRDEAQPSVRNIQETIQRIASAAREASRQPADSAKSREMSPGVRNALSRALDNTVRDLATRARELRNEPPPRWLRSTIRSTSRAVRPIARETSQLMERIGPLPRVQADPARNWSMPNASFGGATDSAPLLFLVLALVGAAMIVWIMRIQYSRRLQVEAVDERLELALIDQIQNRSALVRAFELLTLSRLGRRAAWWTHRRVARAISERDPDLTQPVEKLAGFYELARYAPAAEPLTADQLAAARDTFRQLYSK